ncbi:putative barnase/colicin E5 family endoribonuclease [Helicobacter felis]|nr:PBECR2 nuclease fold domain-containing protein [Helicobacter felis]
MLPPKSEGSEGGKPLKEESNLKEGNHGDDSITNIDTEQALKILENAPRAQIPKNLDIEGFLKSLEGVENKENFIKHLQKKTDNQSRLAYLNLVEPTLKEWDLKLTKGERSEFIKGFSDGNGEFFSLLITQENDKRLITFIPKTRLKFLQSKIKDADLIQTFTGRAGDSVWPRIGEDSTDRLKDTPLDFDQIKEYAHQQATTLYNTAKEQEGGFRGLLEGIPGQHSLEAGNLLKSVESIESKIKRKRGDIGGINDFLRGALIAPSREHLDSQLVNITKHLQTQGILHKIEYKQNTSGYKGVHIQFNYNGVGSEIQLHTAQNWEIKKQLDEIYHVLREQEINPTLTQAEWERLNRESKRLAQDFDVDINLFTSFEVISTESKSAASLNSRNATNEENLTHILRLKSYSKTPPSSDASAYNRPDSVLNQKEEILTGGKGIDAIQAPLAQDSTQGLKDKPLLLTYKNTQELVTHAKAEGLSPARIGQLVQERKQAIAGLLPFKREANINSVIFKEDIKNNAQIVLEGRQAYLSHAQLLQALSKAKELRSTSPSAHTLVQRKKQSRLAQLQDNTLAHQWLKAFNLKSLDEPFIPQFSPAVQQALEPILKGEQIQLTRGSLVKLEKRQREEFLPYIKPALEQSDMILRDKENALIFVKDIGKKYYFTSVARSKDGAWTIRTNSFKTLNRLKNIVGDLGEVLHVSEKAPNILAETFKVKAFSNQLADHSNTTGLKGQIQPNPAFGENFSEFEGKGAQAVAKLLKEKHGQVAGAFYREDLGYIDLVWGDSKKGLAHILERRTQQYGEQQALEFIHNLPRMLQEAKFYKELENKIELVTPTDMIVLGKRGDNKFVLTGFKDRRSKDRFKELENPQTRDDVGFTGKSVSEPQTKDDVLLPNQDNNTKPPLKKDKPRGKEITPDIKWHLTHFSAGAKAKLLRKDFKTPSMFAPSYLNLSPQATKALQPLLKGGKLEYAFESVHQLIRHHTEQYPYMQMALEAPDIILKDKKDALTFVKEFQETTYSIRLVKNAQNQKWHVKNAMPSDSKALQAMVKDGGQVLLGKNLLKALKVGPNPAFGENFSEFEGKGAQAVAKLLKEKRGQVAGAFYREDLGHIDLVWGNVGVGKTKGIGLSKILDKHADDFRVFEGASPQEKVANGIAEIINKGYVLENAGVYTIRFRNQKGSFRVGLSKGWNEQGNNHWIITAYRDD